MKERPAEEEKLNKHKLVGNQNGNNEEEARHVNGFQLNSVRIQDPFGVALRSVAYFSAVVIFICLLTFVCWPF